MKIAEIREVIDSLNWARRDFTGGTSEENQRFQLEQRLTPYIEDAKALVIPARFTRDIEMRDSAVRYSLESIERWKQKQLAESK